MANMVLKYMIIMIGFLNIISNEAIMEFSISATSPVILDITSPFRSVVKNPIGKLITFLNTNVRISRTTPERIGIMKYELR